MKNKKILVFAIIIILLILGGGAFLYFNSNKSQQVEIEEVKQYNYFILKQKEKCGVIDRKGNIVVKVEYDKIKLPNPEKAVFVCYQGDNTKVLNEKAEQILTQYENLDVIEFKNVTTDLMYEKSVLKFKKDEKYGIVDFNGKEKAKPIYDEIESLQFKEGELLVKKDGKYGVINIYGGKVIKPEYDEIKSDEYYTSEYKYGHSGYIVSNKTEEGYRYGYIDYDGNKILPLEYNEISKVADDYIICAKNGQFGVNKNKDTIINNEYKSIRYDSNNKIFIVEKSKKYGASDLEGKLIIPVRFNQIDITGEYLYAQNEQGTTVYKNNGEEAKIEPHIAILNTENDKYRIKIDNQNGSKYGVINKSDKQIIGEKYNYIEYLYDNIFIVSDESGKLGVIDDNDKVLVEINKNSLQRVDGTDLIQTYIIDNENKTIELYDRKMKKICSMSNATVELKNDYVKIYNDDESKYFDKEGKEVEVSKVYPNNKLFVEVKNNKYGYKDSNGKSVVECKYDKAFEFNEFGYATIQKNGKCGAINEKGEEIVEPVYNYNKNDRIEFIGKYYRTNFGFGEFYYTDDERQ